MGFCLHVCLCTTCIPDVLGDQEKMSSALGLESQMLMIFHVGVKIKCRSSEEQLGIQTTEPSLVPCIFKYILRSDIAVL